MGNTIYSSVSRSNYVKSASTKSVGDIFTQNRKKEVHPDMSPVKLGIREARDSDVHPETIPIIIALDVTGSMGRIPVRIVKDDLTHLMESIIHHGELKDAAIMFLAIGDQQYDKGPLQVGQFESGDQELTKWLERTWLEYGGGPDSKESYALAWLVAASHTALDSIEKRNTKGFLFTIGDEGFHETCDVNKVFGVPMQTPPSSLDALKQAQKKFDVYHIHANHGNYPDNEAILSQWKSALGQNLLMANNDKEIIDRIIQTILAREEGITSVPMEETKDSGSTEQEIL